MDVSLTVVIATHGRPSLLKQTLDSIAQCELPPGYKELVVIENGSRAGAQALVRSLPSRLNARYMHRERGNKSYALNEALDTIADGLVVFFDDDVRVVPGVLVAYGRAARKHGRGHYFGGPVRVDRKSALPEFAESFFPYSVRGYDLVNDRWKDKYLGFNWAAFREDLMRVGGFNTELGPGADSGTNLGDESELQDRLMESGYKSVDVLPSVVYHYVPDENTRLSWLVNRKYEVGIMMAIQSKSESVPELGGIPKWIWRVVFGHLRCLLKSGLRGDWERSTAEFFRLVERIGLAHGHLLSD